MYKKIALFLLLAFSLTLGACAPTPTIAPPTSQPTRTLSVSGQGTVYLPPDVAYINIGVHTENPSPSNAVEENNLQIQKLIQILRENGVDQKDIQTSNFSIFINYNYTPEGTRGDAFYVVENTVMVTVRDLSKIGTLLDAAVKAGANSIYGIQFDISDKSEAFKKAREQAFKNAQEQAQEAARLSGVNLGAIQTISFSEGFGVPIPLKGEGGGGGPAMAVAEVPVQPGQISVSVTVNITYEIK